MYFWTVLIIFISLGKTFLDIYPYMRPDKAMCSVSFNYLYPIYELSINKKIEFSTVLISVRPFPIPFHSQLNDPPCR